MKPAICVICGNRSPIAEGDWVEFSDYTADSTNQITHPKGLEWFCNEHIEAAKSVSNLTASEGVKKVLEVYQTPKDASMSSNNSGESLQKDKKSIVNTIVNMFSSKKRTKKFF